MTRQVDRIEMPEFRNGPCVRRHLLFAGYVQGVGFRFEVMCLAEKLGLTGWVRNLADGRVEAEAQGGEDRIAFLIQYMRSLKRLSVESVEIKEMPTLPDEKDFIVRT
ncbi:MAG: acylphosphatase [Oscillospiraceae bacterium]|nr:acylphosphatase [Oscillospiraceae bacterium]